MSQAELQSDSPNADPGRSSTAASQPDLPTSQSAPPEQTGGVAQRAVPPPPPTDSSAVVPPPPPPRSTLPPVRPPAAPKVLNGVGSAKGIRWRGQIEQVGKTSQPQPQSPQKQQPTDAKQQEATASDHVSREAPPWLVSLVTHLILLLVLALISTPAGSGLGKVILEIGQSEREADVELAEFEISTDDVISESENDSDAMVEVDVDDMFSSAELSQIEELTPVDFGVGMEMAAVKPMFDGRSGAMKQALLAIYGGTEETQNAVALGLEWLKRNQRKKGNWSMRGPYRDGGSSENETAATAMALLAFLGDGHTHMKGNYPKVVERGMKFLTSRQDRDGFFARGARGHQKMYAQAQATIAICELYAMTKDSWLRPKAQLALDFAMKSQSAEGGWRYEPNYDSDTSVTGWFVMALESGRAAGLNVDVSVLAKVNQYLDTASSFDDAAYGYQPRSNPSPAMTAEGLLCRQYTKWTRDHPPLRRGLQALLDDAPMNMSDRDVYYWYYATQALHHYGGSEWREWNDVMKVELPRAQVRDGREVGSWPPQRDRWGSNFGRLYTTCMSLYCLEVYYRHMPLYAADGKQIK